MAVVISQGVTEFEDSDGYLLIAGGISAPVPASGDSLQFDQLAAGSRFEATLDGLAHDCWVAANTRSRIVVADSIGVLHFVVHCSTQQSAIRVVIHTQGVNIPPRPHSLIRDGVPSAVGQNDTLIFYGLPGGTTRLRLEGATAGCWPYDTSTRTWVFPAPGQEITVAFDVACGVILFHAFPPGAPAQFFQVNVTTREIRALSQMHTNAQGFRQSPTSDEIAFFAFNMVPNGNDEIYLMTPGTTDIRTLMQTAHDEFWLNWDPSGTALWYSDWEDHAIRRVDISSKAIINIPRIADREYEPTPRPQGDLLAYDHEVGGYVQVWTMTPEGDDRHPAFPVDWFLANPSWSPTGDRLAVSGLEDWTGDRIKLFVGAPGTVPTQITFPDALMSDGVPQWSPDGAWIAFIRYPNAEFGQLWLVRPDGTELHRIDIPYDWNGDFGWVR